MNWSSVSGFTVAAGEEVFKICLSHVYDVPARMCGPRAAQHHLSYFTDAASALQLVYPDMPGWRCSAPCLALCHRILSVSDDVRSRCVSDFLVCGPPVRYGVVASGIVSAPLGATVPDDGRSRVDGGVGTRPVSSCIEPARTVGV